MSTRSSSWVCPLGCLRQVRRSSTLSLLKIAPWCGGYCVGPGTLVCRLCQVVSARASPPLRLAPGAITHLTSDPIAKRDAVHGVFRKSPPAASEQRHDGAESPWSLTLRQYPMPSPPLLNTLLTRNPRLARPHRMRLRHCSRHAARRQTCAAVCLHRHVHQRPCLAEFPGACLRTLSSCIKSPLLSPFCSWYLPDMRDGCPSARFCKLALRCRVPGGGALAAAGGGGR